MTTPDLTGHLATTFLPFRVDGLISEASRARMAEVAALVPAPASGFFGFECRLADPDPSADFLACISASGGGREAWLAGIPPAGLEAEPAWQRLAGFVRDWADPASAFHAPVVNMWVEFDLVGPPARIPSVFIGSKDLGPAQAGAGGHAWLIDAVERLAGTALGEGQRQTIAACLAALPEEGRLFQTGMMLSRAEPVLRLCLKGMPKDGIVAYLGRIGWQGDGDGLGALVAELAPLVDDIHVDLDVGSRVHGKVGLECYITEDDKLQPRLSAFLRYLIDSGLSTETKAGALGAWYGITHERWCGDRWPADLRDRTDRPEGVHSGAFVRTLHHVKVVFDPPRAREAKAYLGSRFSWIDDVKLKASLEKDEGPAAPAEAAEQMLGEAAPGWDVREPALAEG